MFGYVLQITSLHLPHHSVGELLSEVICYFLAYTNTFTFPYQV